MQAAYFTHLLNIQGLSLEAIHALFRSATVFLQNPAHLLIGRLNPTVLNVFFENSTRTRGSFEIAAKTLGINVININPSVSSVSKGETLSDTAHSLAAMGADAIILRHPMSGAAQFLAQTLPKGIGVINAGDGQHAHPTQALLDCFTILQHKTCIRSLKIAIIGDILHSRVARSQIALLSRLGCQDIRLIGPKTLLPPVTPKKNVTLHHHHESGLAGVDVVVTLRLQKERMQPATLYRWQAFQRQYCLTPARLAMAHPDVIVLHPGPMNRGVEIDSQIADSPQCLCLQQIKFGVAIRAAILMHLLC